jgi:hypothetical protein
MTLPQNIAELKVWTAVAALAYLLLLVQIELVKQKRSAGLAGIKPSYSVRLHYWSFDSVTFATSTMLILGFFSEPTMRAIGDTWGFLFLGGLAGVPVTLQAMFD